jgi:hypothetical protein
MPRQIEVVFFFERLLFPWKSEQPGPTPGDGIGERTDRYPEAMWEVGLERAALRRMMEAAAVVPTSN